MFELFNKTKQFLPEKVSKNEEKIAPTITDPQLLAQKRKELSELVRKAAEDGEITSIEYDELRELTVQVGVNNYELNELIRSEYKKALIAKVKRFVMDDGGVSDNEMQILMNRAKELDVSEESLNEYIQEAITQYDREEERRRAERKKANAPLREERRQKFGEKVAKLGKIVAIAGAAVGAAAVFLKAQETSVNRTAAKNGNYKVSLTTVMHKSAKNQ